MLPAYPSPIVGEVLSNYVIRLALSNGLRPMRLTVLLGIQGFWKRDPDISVTSEEIERIAEAAGLDPKQLEVCSLRPMMEKLHGGVHPESSPRFVLMPGKHRGVQEARGLPICVACVRETGVVLREWRLTTSIVCERHGMALLDACPRCGHPVHHVRPHLSRRGVVAHRLSECWQCRCPYPLPQTLSVEVLSAAGFLQDLMRQATTRTTVNWKGLEIASREFQAILETVLRQHYPLREETGVAKWRPETVCIRERFRIMVAGGDDLRVGLPALLWRWRGKNILPHDVCGTRLELPKGYRTLVEMALARNMRQMMPKLEGRETFNFTDRQWRIVSEVLVPVARTSRHGHPVKQILRAWLTRHLRCARRDTWTGAMTGHVSYQAMSRRIQHMAEEGSLDRVVGKMLEDLPELLPVLTTPAVVLGLDQLRSQHARRLWELMVETQVRVWCGVCSAPTPEGHAVVVSVDSPVASEVVPRAVP